MTNNSANTYFEQSTLPFGTALNAESSGYSNQVFTSYDRSTVASLDYAVNRSYSSGQGRFTSVDPIGMSSSSIGNPQSLNLFAYVENNPIDFVDPSGLDSTPSNCVYDAERGITICTETVEVRSDPFDTDEWRMFLSHSMEFRRTLPMPVLVNTESFVVNVTADPDPVTTTTGSVSTNIQQRNDCLEFARIVDNYANIATSNRQFARFVYDEFKNRNDERNYTLTGFREDFVDTDRGSRASPNQVRHAAGAFFSGHLAGASFAFYRKYIAPIHNNPVSRAVALNAAINLMNSREHEPGRDKPYVRSSGDIRLNGVAVPLGFRLGNGEIGRNDVGNLIRSDICAP